MLIVPYATLVLYTVPVVVGVRRALLCDSLYLSLSCRSHRRPPIQYKLNSQGREGEEEGGLVLVFSFPVR